MGYYGMRGLELRATEGRGLLWDAGYYGMATPQQGRAGVGGGWGEGGKGEGYRDISHPSGRPAIAGTPPRRSASCSPRRCPTRSPCRDRTPRLDRTPRQNAAPTALPARRALMTSASSRRALMTSASSRRALMTSRGAAEAWVRAELRPLSAAGGTRVRIPGGSSEVTWSRGPPKWHRSVPKWGPHGSPWRPMSFYGVSMAPHGSLWAPYGSQWGLPELLMGPPF